MESWDLPPGPIGATIPYLNSTESLKDLAPTLEEMKYTLNLCNENLGYLYRSCYSWSVTVTWSFSNSANLVVSVDDDILEKCDKMDTNEYLSKMMHNIGIVIIGIAYMALLVKEFVRRLRSYREAKAVHAVAARAYACNLDADCFAGAQGELTRKVLTVPWSRLPWTVFLNTSSARVNTAWTK